MEGQLKLTTIAGNALLDLSIYLEVIDPELYSEPIALLSGSTIGQHTRHIIEFFKCLIVQSNAGPAVIINYAKRERDLQIETHPDHALELVHVISELIKELDLLQPCRLDCGEHRADETLVASTVGRELVYNIEHTIHHLAIVKIALRNAMPALILPAHFGVAPSTITHRLEACAQ